MTLLLAVALALQSGEDLDRVAALVDASASDDGLAEETQRRLRKAGPAVLPHLAARFPGERTRRLRCGTGDDPFGRHAIVDAMMSFGDAAIPHVTPLLRHRTAETRHMAAWVLEYLPSERALPALFDALDDRDPETEKRAWSAVRRITCRRFISSADYRAWYAGRGKQGRAEWIREAVGPLEERTVSREDVLRALASLKGADRVDLLLAAHLDRKWPEALLHLRSQVGAVPIRDDEGWARFRALDAAGRDLRMAVHHPHGLRWSDAGEPARVLRAAPEAAFDLLEAWMRDHACASCGTVLSVVMSATNWDRAMRLLERAPLRENGSLILRNLEREDCAVRLIEILGRGDAGDDWRYALAFPRLCRPANTEAIVAALATSKDRAREALIEGLGRTGDPKAWPVLKREMFETGAYVGYHGWTLANFAGEEPLKYARALLKAGHPQHRAIAARVLADRGDHSGIPVLIADIKAGSDSLSIGRACEIVGRPVPGESPREQGEWLEAWWARNRDRSRVDWLIDSWQDMKGPYAGEAWYPDVTSDSVFNPLVHLAREALEGVAALSPEEAVARLRAWAKSTGFRFSEQTARIQYGRK